MSEYKDNYAIEEDEIDIKQLFKTILYRKYSIIIVTTLITAIAIVYSYYQPNIYQASSTLELESEKKGGFSQDILAEALNGSAGSNLDTEIEVIKSRFLVEKVVKKLHLNKEHIGVNKLYKKIYYYNNAPFNLNLIKGKKLTFKITPKTNNSFLLETTINSNGEKIEYKKEHLFNKEIKNNFFTIKVNKDNNSSLDMKYYIVSATPASYYADKIRGSQLSVSTPAKKADILKISYTDKVAQRAKDVVDTLTNVYMKQSLERKTQEATFTLKFVNEQLKKIEANLKRASKKLEEFKKRNKTVNVKESITQLSQQLAEYENQKSILNMKLTGIKKVISQIKRGNLETLTLAGVGIEDQSIGTLITELQQALIKQKELLKNYTREHKEVKKVSTRIAQLKRIISRSIKNVLSNLNQRKIVLDRKLNELQKKLKSLPKQEQDYIGLERNFLFNDKFYTYLMEKKTETEIKKAATISKNRVLDLPLLPEKPIKPKRKLIVTVGFILGLILGMALAFVREFLDNTIKDEEDIEQNIKAPMLGIVPSYRNDIKERTLVVLESPKSPTAEAFRNIRTNLQFMLKGNDSFVVSITSTIAKEGKTSISANLAGALSLLKKRVVIVNLDLRKPTLHEIFEVSNAKGASNYLSNSISLQEALHKTKYEYIDIVPAGPIPPNPNELIASKKLTQMLEELKREYDVVILDTPPVGLVADSKVIIKHSDLTIYTLRANYSKKEFSKLINELYKDSKNIAVLLNDVKVSNKGYGYGYGSGYGYGYY